MPLLRRDALEGRSRSVDRLSGDDDIPVYAWSERQSGVSLRGDVDVPGGNGEVKTVCEVSLQHFCIGVSFCWSTRSMKPL